MTYSLNHYYSKNIINFQTFFMYDNKFYTVMDYARGGELSTYLDQTRKLPEEEAKTEENTKRLTEYMNKQFENMNPTHWDRYGNKECANLPILNFPPYTSFLRLSCSPKRKNKWNYGNRD